MKFTLAKISEFIEGDLREIKKLNLSGKGIDKLEDLSFCIELRQLDLSNNEIDDLEFLRHCPSLSTLNLSNNCLTTLYGLESLSTLSVLNVSKNDIRTLRQVNGLKNLKALIASNTAINGIPPLQLPLLNTFVFSYNSVENISSVCTLRKLTKISAAHNKIREIPVLKDIESLTELRLSNNLILKVPETIRQNITLKIIDLGNNRLHSFTDIEALAGLPNLKSLTLKGNKLCNCEDYREKVKLLIPSLEILDDKRFTGKKLERIRKKRKMREKKERKERKKRLKPQQSSKQDHSYSKTAQKKVETELERQIDDAKCAPISHTSEEHVTNETRESLRSGLLGVIRNQSSKSLRSSSKLVNTAEVFNSGQHEIGAGGQSAWK